VIKYLESAQYLRPDQLIGFFEGWPHPPSTARHLDILKAAHRVVLAVDSDNNRVVGFVNAISDGIQSAYIPLLEVLPEYRKRGIAAELVKRLVDQYRNLYMIDLVCDENLRPFYARLGFRPHTAMMIRNFDRQAGE
jgi:GNAT superfamily N-acetyltransferase